MNHQPPILYWYFPSFFIICFVLSACHKQNGTSLKEIKIGSQIWSYNLTDETPNSICSGNCEKTGRLYSYSDALLLEKKYDGWQLPSEDDWAELEAFLAIENIPNSDSFKSGANKLKKIPGFNKFPGYAGSDKEIIYPAKWASYWVKGRFKTEQFGRVAYSRTLKTEGNQPDMIYKSIMGIDSTNYICIKLIKK